MKIYHYSLSLLVFIILSSCFLTKENVKMDYVDRIATEKFGTDYILVNNSDTTYTVCIKKRNKNVVNPNFVTKFFILDRMKSEVIYEDSIANAKIKWYSKYKIEINIHKGIIKDGADSGVVKYIYDVKSGKKKLKEKKHVK